MAIDHLEMTRMKMTHFPQMLLAGLLIATWIVGSSSDSFYFSVNPTDQDVEEGQPLRLRCTVSPSKDIFYSWIHNGTRVPLESNSGQSGPGGGGVDGVDAGRRRYLEMDSNLQIMHADRDLDQGIYQCEALNRSSLFTTASQEARVNIYWMEPDVHVRLVKPSRYEDIRLGDEVEFNCQANANPPLTAANIKWYHNGNARLPNTAVLRNGNLKIAVLGMEHMGSYHCRVLHAAGKLDSRPPFVLQVNDENPPQLIRSLSHEQFNVFVLRGQSAELTCPRFGPEEEPSVDGIPPITVWGYMPRLGEQQQAVSFLSDVQLVDLDSKLVIHNFDSNHVNYYTCEISWHGSPARYIFIFQVEMTTLYTPKRSDFSPRLKKNQPYIVRIHEEATLRYYSDQSPSASFVVDQISNPPPTIEWYKKGEQNPIPAWPPVITDGFDGAGHYRSMNLATSSSTATPPRRYAYRKRHIIIHQVNEGDSGTYEMVLTNVAGRESMSFDIVVTFPPEFKQPLSHEEHSLDEDASITLDCGIQRRAIRGSVVYWEKDQRLLETFSSGSVVLENNGETLRFPKLKPEDQGQYQCFVQTEGYEKRAAGREQTLIVKGRLQFLREIRMHFLEVNVQGRVSCRVRGYGQLTVNWFRKTGTRPEDLQEIRPPNQVESGTLIIQYVQKHDAGDYVCVAQSSYRNARINMTVQVIVGEKPHISQISSNQTVQVGSRVLLHCQASGDPHPNISWIVKKVNMDSRTVYVPIMSITEPRAAVPQQQANSAETAAGKMTSLSDPSSTGTHRTGDLTRLPRLGLASVGSLHPSNLLGGTHSKDKGGNSKHNSRDRVTAYSNGSLVIQRAYLVDQGEYICVAGNKHALKSRQGVFLRVLTAEEYTRRKLGGSSGAGSSGMMKTIGIVVGCAVAYLGLIIGLTVFCSLQMLRTRRKRSRKTPRSQENGQLLLPVSEQSIKGATTIGNHHHHGNSGTGHTYPGSCTNPLLDATTMGNPEDSQSLSYGPHTHHQHRNGSSGFPPSTADASSFYTPTSGLCNGVQEHPLQPNQHHYRHALPGTTGRHQSPHTTAIQNGVPANSSATLSPAGSNLDPSWWLPVSNQFSYFEANNNPCESRILVSPAGTMEMFPEPSCFDQMSCNNNTNGGDGNHSNPMMDDLLLSGANHGQCFNRHYHHHHPNYYPNCGNTTNMHYSSVCDGGSGLQNNGCIMTGAGSGTTVVTTAASDTHLAVVSAPPPTPLDSRSHLSGMSSSGNSTSLYSRSLLSGASNVDSAVLPTASPTGGGGEQVGRPSSGTAGGGVSRSLLSQTNRMNFHRSELKVEGMLGKGEFGDVFLARPHGSHPTESHSLVLVKSLTSHNPAHINEFHRQLVLFGKADSPHVTRLLGVCMEMEPFYMLLEYCDWGDLQIYLRQVREDSPSSFKLPPLNASQKLVISQQLASGMNYLAEMHCVHRDLAARNVFITPCRMEVKIGSPGLTRDTYANDYYILPGTDQPIALRWLSPELILAFTHRQTSIPYSTGSDVWSFATLLWEVYTLADRPLSWLADQDIISIGTRVAMESGGGGDVTGRSRSVVEMRPDILPSDMPAEVSQLVTRCWSHPVQHRPGFNEINLVLNTSDRHI